MATSVADNSPSSEGLPIKQISILSGCIVLGLVIVIAIAIRFIRRQRRAGPQDKVSATRHSGSCTFSEVSKVSHSLSVYEFSGDHNQITSSGSTPTPLVVLTSPVVRELKFDDLLRAPAELLKKGRNGSMYKITLAGGACLVVKRLKDCSMSADKFSLRMQKIDLVKHPNVLPQVAFYCSSQEKLLVYEFQPNGSLHKLLRERPDGERFGWGARLNVAATLAKALAFMHEHLLHEDISHGNIKSSNILFDKYMKPLLTEYGLRNQDQKGTWKMDVYAFGVLLLELLTGKPVQATNGLDLAKWVNSVVREEWTAEVFDKELISGGAIEERMVNLLQVALKCTSPSPLGRPSMTQVNSMIEAIQVEEEKYFVFQSFEV
ncbi:unnamed protein product [Rhodiola kirilowii]